MTNFTATLFDDRTAKAKREEHVTPAALSEMIRHAAASNKDKLPLLKLARFGDTPSKNGCLRHDANVTTITGVEGDYDGEVISIAEVVGVLTTYGIEAIVYPSPSYRSERPRWRILCPFSEELLPSERDRLIGRLEGLLRHSIKSPAVLGRESWVLSQCYYFGHITNGIVQPAPEHVNATPIDLLDNLDEFRVERPSGKSSGTANGKPNLRTSSPPQAPIEDIAAALDVIPNPWPDWTPTDSWEDWNNIGMAIWRASGGSDEGFVVFDRWSTKNEAKYDPDETRLRWDHYAHSPPGEIGAGKLFHTAAQYQKGWAPPSRREIDRLAELPLLQYGQEREPARKRLGITAKILDQLVNKARRRARQRSAEERKEQPVTEVEWERDIRGGIRSTVLPNVKKALALLDVRARHDIFANQMLITIGDGAEKLLDDPTCDRLWLMVEERFHFRPARELFDTVVRDMARQNGFHPAQDYLAGLQWDGERRLDTWLFTYGNVPRRGGEYDRYIATAGRIMLIAAVRRIRHPGCKFDEMLVLVSETQGLDKSSALATLAVRPEWFTDSIDLGAKDKEAIEQLQGKWIVEIAELHGRRKNDIDRIKTFLSRTSDRVRPNRSAIVCSSVALMIQSSCRIALGTAASGR
jgi:hypothetical protein